jgi:tetratricopeptide (TPR) repeat protein
MYPGARNLLARCFFFLGNPDRSIEELEFVLTHNSTDAEKVDSLFVLGASVRDNPNSTPAALKKGLGAWETYLKLAPNSEYALDVRKGIVDLKGRINNAGGMNAQAMASAIKKQPPADANSPKAIGLQAFEKGDLLLAEKKLTEALKEQPADGECLTALGRLYLRSGRSKEAVDTLLKSTRVAKKHSPGWHYLGMAELMGGQIEKAISAWQAVLKNDPDYGKLHQLDERVRVAYSMLKPNTKDTGKTP